LQALGALGIAYQLTDVGRSFQDGTGSGIGRMGRVGVQWGGAEVGSMIGADVGARMALSFLGKGKLGLLTLPVCTVVGAAVGAIGADTLVGTRVDEFLKTTVDKFTG
jgi:hypothetical protein